MEGEGSPGEFSKCTTATANHNISNVQATNRVLIVNLRLCWKRDMKETVEMRLTAEERSSRPITVGLCGSYSAQLCLRMKQVPRLDAPPRQPDILTTAVTPAASETTTK